MSPLEIAILRTVSYFDLFSYPLTELEMWKWLLVDDGRRPSFADVRAALEASAALRQRLGQREGFWALVPFVEERVRQRKERYGIAEEKFKRATAVARVLRFLPFVRGVAVCNSLAYSNARKGSDIDFLVIARPGRLWTCRQFVTGLFSLLRLRPTGGRIADALCFSFYLADPETNLLPVSPLGTSDVYMHYWLDQLVPLFDEEGAFDALRDANAWTRARLPNAFGASSSWRRRAVRTRATAAVQRAGERLLAHPNIEAMCRTFQQRRMPAGLRDRQNRDGGVVVNAAMLKFHDNDRRAAFFDRYERRAQEVLA